MNAKRIAGALLVTTIAIAALNVLALAPYQPASAGTALLRLSWRMRGNVEEKCRDRSAAELEKIPIHMRTARVCERDAVDYELNVAIDGREVLARRLAAAGARGDRPIYVLEEFPLEPGPHRVRIALTADRHDNDDDDHDDDDDDDDEDERTVLDQTIEFQRGRIRLVTLDADRTPRIAR